MNFQSMPNIIMWFIWKRRNTILHGGIYYVDKVIWDITNLTLAFLIKKFGYENLPNSWPHIIAILDEYRQTFQFILVK